MILPVRLFHQTSSPNPRQLLYQPHFHYHSPYLYQKLIFDFQPHFQYQQYKVVHKPGAYPLPGPLFILVSILAPNDVEANMELYERMDLRKYFDKMSPFGFNNPARNGGASFRRGNWTLPPLQQR